MFEALTAKLSQVFRQLSGKGRLSEKDMDEALRQIRVALLEADVSLKVVKNFAARVREKALGAEVMESLTPGQQVVKIVHEELVSLLGEGGRLAPSPHPPSIVLLVGLQGSGKTTTAAKLGVHLRHSGQRCLLVAADPYRPAAIEQLYALGRQLELPVYGEADSPLAVCQRAMAKAREIGATWVIVDSAGRLHIEQEMMAELRELKAALSPAEVLLVVDAMTGQDGVTIAQEFQQQVGLTGAIITKLDGDARGGVALSLREATGVPIKFIGVGEKPEALEPFHPDRLASRILGMGDMLTLIEKAGQVVEEKKAREIEKRLRAGQLNLEDFLEQIRGLKKMGPLSQVLEMVPGLSAMAPHFSPEDEKRVKRVEAIILSMTPQERLHPEIIDGSRRRRLARGSGTSIQEVNQLLNQFSQFQRLFKELGKKGLRGWGKGMAGLPPWSTLQ